MEEKRYFDREVKYHLEVEHTPSTFESDMDFLTASQKDAYERIGHLRLKYPGQKIKITKITKRTNYEPMDENELERTVKLLYLETKIKR